jgi:hypothetical protein
MSNMTIKFILNENKHSCLQGTRNLFLWFQSNYFIPNILLLWKVITYPNILVNGSNPAFSASYPWICFPFDLNCTLSLEIWLLVNFVTGKQQKLTWHVWYRVLVLTPDVETFLNINHSVIINFRKMKYKRPHQPPESVVFKSVFITS